MFSWDDLRHLLAFARTGSTVAAAKALGVNQSTVQRRLSALEERLGEPLIERHLGGYRLTELGNELLPYAERIEEAVSAFERRFAASKKELTGTIRVTCAPSIGERLNRTPLMDAFERRYPGLRVELMMSDRLFDLSRGEADVAIRSRTNEPENESLVGRKIADLGWALYASRAYVERHGRPNCLEDIERHCVIRCDGPMANHAASRWLREIAPQARVGAYSESWPGLILALKSGVGLAPLPIGHGDYESDLVRVIDNIPDLVTHIYLLTHRDLQHTPRVRALFDYVTNEIKAFREFLSGQPSARTAKRDTAKTG